MNKIITALLVIVMVSGEIYSNRKIKVACVGNSVTWGYGIKNRVQNCYPSQLQKLLGDRYSVGNFGHSGATVLRKGHKPYWIKPEFKKATEFDSDIVIIHLGLNDVGLNNWPNHSGDFVRDYSDLIMHFWEQPSRPEVKICRMSPIFSGHHWFEEGLRESYAEAQKKIEEVAELNKVELIDLHQPLYRFPECMPDNLHPTAKGAGFIASRIYSAITGDFGGLKLSPLYSENMVIQRDETILFSGIANKYKDVEVCFGGEVKKVIALEDGKWMVEFPAMKAQKNLKLTIKSEYKSIVINRVHIGEVWLASGQSNMHFKVKSASNVEEILNSKTSDDIYVMKMKGKAYPGNVEFDSLTLTKCNSKDYFEYSPWNQATRENIGDFSAVAYSYAYNLQKKLGVPVGIVCNAIGGSTTQSWISRFEMEKQHITVDLLNDTHKNPYVNKWVNGRKSKNMRERVNIEARHPFDPTFLYDAGIYPIKDYSIKGVIWYQGESNAEREELHEILFQQLVNSWRTAWKNDNLPFYYVQLSSINRSNWPEFRDSQRILMKIPHTGMAVSHDLGNPTDVHPKNKWPIGERLSRWALAEQYVLNIEKSGPLFDYVNVEGNKLVVYFKHTDKGLKVKNGEKIKGFEIAGIDGKFYRANVKIRSHRVVLVSDKVDSPRYVRYGWKPYSEANLVNSEGLPASTFTNYRSLMEL